MKTATKNVKKAAPKTAAKKAPAPKKATPKAATKVEAKVEAKKPATLVDPRIAEKARALDAAVAKLATPGLKATRKEAPKAEPKKARKMGALDAAAIVLADAGKPMRSKDLIAEMAKRGLWTSPGGKTPEATLYAAVLREIGAKGTAARFARAGKGEFASTKKGGA